VADKPVDHEDRERARTDLEHNFVVAAGAGTGKTTLLTDRILFLLLKKQLKVQEIVALTFTEKAAGEIRERVTQKLIDLLAPKRGDWAEAFLEDLGKDIDAVKPLIEGALEAMDRASIGTIHAFASQILKLYPLEAGVDPSFEVDDGDALDGLFDSEWALWLESELGEEPVDREELKRWSLRKEKWLEILRLVSLEDLGVLARTLCEEEVTEAQAVGTTPAVRKRLESMSEAVCALGEGKPGKDTKGGRYGIADEFDRVATALREAAKPVAMEKALPEYLVKLEAGKSLTRKNWPSKWNDFDERQIAEEIGVYTRGRDAAKKISPERERLIAKAVELVMPLVKKVRRYFNRRGYVGYYGLLAKARDLVVENAAVREALKGRFRAILIDEFQDTDPAQGELLLFLGEKKGRSAKKREELKFEAGKLFVVGDPKQSIYRFRGADIRAYEIYKDQLIAEGAVKCSLTANFRSHAGVLGPVNTAFAKIMHAEKGLQPAYEAITPRPASKGAPKAKGLELVGIGADEEAEEGAQISSDDSRAQEAKWIARWISENCGEKNTFRFGDAAILLRTVTSLSTYLEPLKAAGIPYVVEAERYFYDTQEVIDFVNFLRVLDDPSDRIAMVGLLRSPLVCLDDQEVVQLARLRLLSFYSAKELGRAGLTKGGEDRLKRFYGVLNRLHNLVGRVPLGELVGKVLSDSFILELCSEAYQRDQTASNLMKFGRMAAEAGDEGATLKEFIALIVETMRESAQEGESPLADETLDAVRILTVHKSKGLEFPVVFLPNMAAGVAGGGEPPLYKVDWQAGTAGLRLKKRNVCDAAMAVIEAEEAIREDKESLRLLYVAMTRAKEHLVLLGNATKHDAKSFAAFLERADLWNAARLEVVPVSKKISPKTVKRVEAKPKLSPAALGDTWKGREKLRRNVEARSPFVSPSSLGHEPEKHPISEGTDAAQAEAARAFSAQVGIVCHRVLELWDFANEQGVDGEPYKDVFQRALGELLRADPGVDERRVRQEAQSILEHFLKSEAAEELGRSEILARELPFVCPSQDGRVMHGYIDVLYRDPKGRLVVGDYKTAAGADPSPYRAQGDAYADAVEHALGETPDFRIIFLRAGKTIPS
jgi:ATP-dependent helicase/nuclease subunit A